MALGAALMGCAATPPPKDTFWGKDKWAHFAVSGAVGAGAAAIARNNGAGACDASGAGIGLALTVGTGKELYDLYHRHTYFSWNDMAWDLAGGTAGSLMATRCR